MSHNHNDLWSDAMRELNPDVSDAYISSLMAEDGVPYRTDAQKKMDEDKKHEQDLIDLQIDNAKHQKYGQDN